MLEVKISIFCKFHFKTEYIFLVPKRGGAYIKEGANIRGNMVAFLNIRQRNFVLRP